jgi:hypothetical protein
MSQRLSRSATLALLAALPIAAATSGIASAADDSSGTKAQFKYQTKPNGAKKCSGCALFVSPAACKVVKGKISPNGYCMSYAPKAS